MDLDRIYNFSAGPSMLPRSVLREAREELISYGETGCSVMEMSHRSKPFMEIHEQAKSDLRDIMNIPDGYTVLFLQGGASLQFDMIPLNLAREGDVACYAVTGQFAKKAREEAQKYLKVETVFDGETENYARVPLITADMLNKNARYLHITGNNTIFGTQYRNLPECGDIPLVADWSSAILGRTIDVSKHSLIYAGAQKNMGIAGLTVVIIKNSMISTELPDSVPAMLRYDLMAKNDSMYNTPPCYSIYLAGLMFKWVKRMGGVQGLQAINEQKAKELYEYLDNSKLFTPSAEKSSRSIMNVTFTLPSPELTAEFLKTAEECGMINLKGHRAVGGCRASIYNAMPIEGVRKLINVMQAFELGKA